MHWKKFENGEVEGFPQTPGNSIYKNKKETLKTEVKIQFEKRKY